MSITRIISTFLRGLKTAAAGRALRSGEWGERQAERMLAAKGMKILGRRVRVGRRDEIDLVVRDGRELVFIEVKTRRNEDFGRPIRAVDSRKRSAASRAALRYLRKAGQAGACFRFDVVEVIGAEGGPAPAIRHIKNAFGLDRRYRAQ